MKKRITAKALAKYIAKHPGDFEEVDTGYRSRNGEKPVKEWIYHGHKKHVCIHCGGKLAEKTLSVKEKDGRLKIVNGFYKEVETGDGTLYLFWVCSKTCLECDRNQRVFPFFILRGCACSYTPWPKCCIPFLPERSCAARAGCSPGVAAPGTRCPFMANTPQFNGGGSAILKIYIVK